jgi:hypothetical protein
MSADEYENTKITFLSDFSNVNISDIEQKTRGQNDHFDLRLRLVNLETCVKCVIQGLPELADQNNTVKSLSSGNNRKNI